MLQFQSKLQSLQQDGASSTDQSVLSGDRICIRNLKPSDAGALSIYLADERVAKATATIPYPLTPGLVENLLKRASDEDNPEHFWAIEHLEGDGRPFAGLVSLECLTARQAELRFWVAPIFWNSGLASEALSLLMSENPLSYQSIVASVFQDNSASNKVVERVGFECVGESEVYSLARDVVVPSFDYIYRYDAAQVQETLLRSSKTLSSSS